MGARSVMRGMFATLLAVPVMAVAAAAPVGVPSASAAPVECLNVDGCDGSLNLVSSVVGGGVYAVNYTVSDGVTDVASGSLNDIVASVDDRVTLTGGTTYTVTFDGPSPYVYIVNTDCDTLSPTPVSTGVVSFTYAVEQPTTVTCFVELGMKATLTVEKFTDFAVDETFAFVAHGESEEVPIDVDVSSNVFLFGGGGSTSVWLTPGEWSVDELADPWWRLADVQCRDDRNQPFDVNGFLAEPGGTYRCQFNNELGAAVLIDKDYVSGAKGSTTFMGTWSPDPFEILTDGPNEPIWIPAGQHTVTELGGGYLPSGQCTTNVGESSVDSFGGPSVDFTAPYGSMTVCSFSNWALPVVHISKYVDTVTDNPTFTFTSSEGSTEVVAHQPGEVGPIATEGTLVVRPGAQTIFEGGSLGWELDGVTCVDEGENPVGVDTGPGNAFVVNLEVGDEIWCNVYNVRALSLDKAAVSLTPTGERGVYDAEWTVTITNPFPDVVSFDSSTLVDSLDAEASVDLLDFHATDPNDAPIADADITGVLATDVEVPGQSSLTWHVYATVRILPNAGPSVLFCPGVFGGEPSGLVNVAALEYSDSEAGDGALTAYSCIDLPAADPTVDKVADGGPQPVDGSWSQAYTITVSNPTDGFASADLYETIDFGLPFEVVGFTVQGPGGGPADEYDVWSTPQLIAGGVLLGAHETVTFEVVVTFDAVVPDAVDFFDGEVNLEGWFCDTGLGGGAPSGLLNRVDIVVDGFVGLAELGPWASASACHDGPSPNLVIDKNIVDYHYVNNDAVVVDYDIVVDNSANDDNSLPLDAPFFFMESATPAGGIEIADWELLGVDGGVENEDFELSADPYGQMMVLGIVPADATMVFHVRYTYLVDIEIGWNGQCFDGTLDTEFFAGQLGGAYNLVLWIDPFTTGSGILPIFSGPLAGSASRQRLERAIALPPQASGLGVAYDCLPLSGVWIHKDVVNDNGGDMDPGDFSFAVTPTGPSACDPAPCPSEPVARVVDEDTPTLVVSGDYVLSEDVVDGYDQGYFSCEGIYLGDRVPDIVPLSLDEYGGGLAAAGRPVRTEVPADPGNLPLTMEASYGYDCSITNEDAPADLSLTKSDGGATAIAGGAPVTFTFTVTNEWGFASSDATVTDELPAGWSWDADSVVGCPTTATFIGQAMQCTIPAASLALTGDSVQFSVQASLAADAASGDYLNMAVVDSEDDPVSATPACLTLVGLGAREANNVACEVTPAERAATMSATKVSNAAGPVAIGGTVVFTLTVTNHGPSTVLAGTTMLDDLPAGLTFISAIGSGWSCSAVDPVVCEYGSDIGVGETAPPVLVTTKIAVGASGTITNTGTFTGIVDVEPVDLTDVPRPTEVSLAAQPVVVTATAVASAVAVVQVRSGGTIPVTGADSLAWARLSVALVGVGGAAWLVSRRRRRPA